MTSETPSTRKTEPASATGATKHAKGTRSTSSKPSHHTMINCKYGCYDPLTCSYPHEGCEHCYNARTAKSARLEWPAHPVNEAEAKAAARLLIGTIETGNYYFSETEQSAAYQILKKWSEQR